MTRKERRARQRDWRVPPQSLTCARRLRLAALRLALVTGVSLAALTVTSWTFPELDLASQYAEAQIVPVSSPTAVATVTASATAPVAATVPLPTATPTAPAAPPDTATATSSWTASATSPTSTPTPAGTSTPAPTPTVPNVDLPPVKPRPDDPGTAVEQLIDSTGGMVATNDGRAALVFPSGALASSAMVSVRDLAPADAPPSIPNHLFVGGWQFTAVDASSPATAISTFAQPVSLVLRLNANDLFRYNPATLQLWTLDPLAKTWQEVPIGLSASSGTLTAQLSHFSIYGLSADSNFNMAPFSDVASVDLHGGGANLSIPIEVPAGPGGLAPNLNLTYDSGRVSSMRSLTALGSWAGIGWSLSAGSISGDPDGYDGYGAGLSLEANGISGRLEQNDPVTKLWWMSDHTFNRIEFLDAQGNRIVWNQATSACQLVYIKYGGCTWRVTDKRGTQYLFRHQRTNGPWNSKTVYQWDLSEIIDVNGNQVTLNYVDGTGDSYLSSVVWGAGNAYSVVFTAAANRPDAPVSTTCGGHPYTAPPVQEAYQLTDVTVKVNGLQLKDYRLGFNEISPFNVNHYPGCVPWSGQMTLASLTEYGKDSSRSLRTMNFTYGQTATVQARFNDGYSYTTYTAQPWPLLTNWKNGLGGSVSFDYTMKGFAADPVASDSCWTQDVVTRKTVAGGAGQPPVVTTYGYALGPDAEWQGSISNSCFSYNNYYLKQRYLGFGDVTETTASDSTTEHCFYTSRNANPNGATFDSQLAGREHETWVWGTSVAHPGACAEPVGTATGADLWQHTVNTWQTASLGDVCPALFGCPYWPAQIPHFNYLIQSATTVQDGDPSNVPVQTYSQYIYDVNSTPQPANWYGDLLQTNSFIGAAPVNPSQVSASACGPPSYGNCVLSTFTPMTQDATDWIFVPILDAKTDPINYGNPGQLMSCTWYFYDGQTTPGALPLTGAHGLATAKSVAATVSPATATACATTSGFFSTSSTSYAAYDQYGNVVATSRPSGTLPQYAPSQLVPAGAARGWVSSDTPYTLTTYDSTYHVFPTSTQTLLNDTTGVALQTTAYAHNDLLSFIQGVPATATGPTGRITSYQYDSFGRLSQTFDNHNPDEPGIPSGSATTPLASYTYDWNAVSNRTTTEQFTSDSTGRYSVICYDGFGRTVETRQSYLDTAFGTVMSSVRTDYDATGRTAVQSAAAVSNSSRQCDGNPAPPVLARDRTAYTYDALGNTTTTTHLAANQTTGPSTQSIAQGLTTTQIDENAHQTTRTIVPQLSLGVVISRITEYTGTSPYTAHSTTATVQDALGRAIQVTDGLGNRTTMAYDLGSRKTTMTDPDMGTWAYTYDAAGNLLTQTDAHTPTHIVTTLQYDSLNRLTSKSYSNGDPSSHYVYDSYASTIMSGLCPQSAATAIGREVESYVGTLPTYVNASQTCYDTRGQGMLSWTGIGPNQYQMSYQHDWLGNTNQMTFPDSSGNPNGETVAADYSSNTGNLTGLRSATLGGSYIKQAYTTPWGAPGGLALGNGLTTRYGYDSRQRPIDIQTGSSTGGLLAQHEALAYDDASNVTSVSDKTSGELASYAYDEFNRLTTMSLNGVAAASYGYDAIGNLTSKQEGLNGANPLTLCYPASGSSSVRPHAVTSVYNTPGATCASPSPWLTLSYDANGNLASDTNTTYTYNAENRLQTRGVSGGNESYIYDAQGTMVRRTNPDGTYTDYVGGVYEASRAANDTLTDTTRYYQAFGRNIAMRTSSAPCSSGSCYLLADHLGSTVGMTDSSGTVLSTQKYWPYGATRSGGVTQTDKLYTGQQVEPGDSALGLYNYKARFYSTTLGRFASADSWSGDGLNRYAYVGGNPVLRIDPTGHGCESPAPCPSQLPTPAESDPLTACAQNFGACLAWSLFFQYGNTDIGLVIVMGLFHGDDDIALYWGYAQEFLERTHPGCKGRADACWAAAKELMKAAGADAVYDRFGLKLIQSDPGGLLVGAAFSDRGTRALDKILNDPRGKTIAGVIGHSLGALTVATYFATHERRRDIPYFLDEPPFPASWANRLTRNLAGSFGWWSCDDCGSTFAGIGTQHGPHNEQAGQALDALDRKRAELTVDMAGG